MTKQNEHSGGQEWKQTYANLYNNVTDARNKYQIAKTKPLDQAKSNQNLSHILQ